MAKRRKKKNSSKFLIYLIWFLMIIAIILSSLVAGYYFGYEDAKEEIRTKSDLLKKKRLSTLKRLKDKSAKKVNSSVNERLKKVLKEESKSFIAASHEYDDISLIDPPKPPKRVKRAVKRVSTKPKLAIIIDDVSVRSHVVAIKSIGFPITMSFLPPSIFRPKSAKLASKEKIYMVHLPLEAENFRAEEPLTLRVGDSEAKISQRVSNIKKMFPRVKYLNNHTGSKFTSNELAMNRLLYALKSQKINFIDSRTTAKTKAPKVMKNLGLHYVARDVFLDNKVDKVSIKIQIKRAVKIAKLHGTAIAIGHPHPNTLIALSESKALLKDVELVYIDKLY
ncbi:MAG: divergent polysaccharide deacetylase family protein [Sulfurimonas sp.]|nr:divergent polysaccharide deacetylase family protein [Sulfurimonas sp.]